MVVISVQHPTNRYGYLKAIMVVIMVVIIMIMIIVITACRRSLSSGPASTP